jgi:hypothetical protein
MRNQTGVESFSKRRKRHRRGAPEKINVLVAGVYASVLDGADKSSNRGLRTDEILSLFIRSMEGSDGRKGLLNDDMPRCHCRAMLRYSGYEFVYDNWPFFR